MPPRLRPALVMATLAVVACSSSGQKSNAPTASAFESDRASGAPSQEPSSDAGAFNDVLPIANAGPDLEVLRGTEVVLDGRRSFHPGRIAFDTRWSQIGGENTVTLSNPARTVTSFIAPGTIDELVFRLEAGAPESTADIVVVRVIASTPKQAPVVLSSGDVRAAAQTHTTLTALTLGPPLDGPVRWSQVYGPKVTPAVTGAGGEQLDVPAPEQGLLVFAAEGTAAGLASAPDFTLILVSTTALGEVAMAPQAPSELEKTPPLLAEPNKGVTLLPPDGSTGAWVQLSGPSVVLDESTTGWKFIAPARVGDLRFAYYRDDGDLRAAPFVRTVKVSTPALEGRNPDAGPDRLAHPGSTVVLTGSAGGTENGVVGYRWQRTLGPTVEVNGSSTPSPFFLAPTAPAELVFVLELTDGSAHSSADSVVVRVVPESENQPPLTTVRVVSSNASSYALAADTIDPERDELASFTWSVEPTSAGAFSDPSTPQTTFNLSAAEALVSCRVCDSLSACETSSIHIP